MTYSIKMPLIVLFILSFQSDTFAWDVPPSIYPIEIRFNHSVGYYTTDAIDLKDRLSFAVIFDNTETRIYDVKLPK